jgi:hypothetical protein
VKVSTLFNRGVPPEIVAVRCAVAVDDLRAANMDALPVILDRLDEVTKIMDQYATQLESNFGIPIPRIWLGGLASLKFRLQDAKAEAPAADLERLKTIADLILE